MTLPGGQQAAPFTSSLAISSLRATLLVVNSAAGLLVNNNATGGVWVSNASSVANDGSGGGVYIGPLGSLRWGGGPLYGVLDGVTNPTANTCVLTYTNNAADPVNPVAVGVAVATQLLVTGVPLVYQTVAIENINLPSNTQISPPSGVGQYGSLLLRIGNQVAGQKCAISLLWFADAACTQPTGIGDNLTLGNHPNTVMVDAWEIPVRGLGLQIISRPASQGTVSLFLQGTNRTVPSIKQILTTQLPRVLGFATQNVTAGVPVPLVNQDLLGDYTTLNGNVIAGLAVSAGNTGQLVFFYTEFNCAEGGLGVGAVAAATGAQAGFNHPNIPIRWQWIPSVTTANVQLSMILMPAGPT